MRNRNINWFGLSGNYSTAQISATELRQPAGKTDTLILYLYC